MTEDPKAAVGYPLSHREYEICGLIADGLSNKQIAQRLNLSGSTVKEHVQHVFTKLKVHNRVEATRWFITGKVVTRMPTLD